MTTKRRGRNEGSIHFLESKGLWCAQLTTGYDANAARKRRSVYGKTKNEVQKKLLAFQTALATGSLADPKRMRLAEFLKHWLEDVARPAIRATTHASYEITIRLHINPYIGGIQLGILQPGHLQNFYRKLEDAGASPRKREYVHVVLRRALQQAVQWNYLNRNLCDMLVRPRVPQREMQCLNSDQAKELINVAADDRYHALYVLALTTGLRQGELFGLQWSDIDLIGATLSVQRTIYELNGKQQIGEPKTVKSRRKVEIPHMAVLALKKHREKMLAEGHHILWVFCDTDGKPVRRSNFRKRSFMKLIEKANLPAIRFHDLRHTAATLLLSQGVHPKIVQERLGHSQISMTLDTYSHVLPSMQREAASKLDTLLASDMGGP